MSTGLERSYRRALRWYPRGWREKNADVVAGTLLDVADAEHRDRARRGELANLAASGIATRLGVMLEPQARNAISTIALATGFAYPVVYLLFQLWSMLALPRPPYAAPILSVLSVPGPIVAATWVLVLILALTRRRRGVKLAIAVAILASIVLSLSYRLPGISTEWYGLTTTSMAFLALLGVLVLIGTPARGVRLLIPTGIAFAVIAGSYLATQLVLQGLYFDERFFWNNFSGTLTILLAIAALAVVVLGLAHHRVAAQTVAVSAIPWALVVFRFAASQDLWNTLGLLGIAVALVGFGALLPLAFRRVRPNGSSKGEQNMTSLP
jgi:hypothetical protein